MSPGLSTVFSATTAPLAVTLIFFFSYVICMKVTAFLQPLTHKLCNKMFHETDPIPQAMPEETAGGENAPENPEGDEKNGEVTEQQNK